MTEKLLNTDNKLYVIMDNETNLIVNSMICTNEAEAVKNYKIAIKNLKNMISKNNKEEIEINLDYKLIEMDKYHEIEDITI